MKIGRGEAVKGAYKVAHPRADPLTAYNEQMLNKTQSERIPTNAGNVDACL